MSKNQFRGVVVSGVEYTDREAFEKAARDAGHRLGNNRTGDWRVGHPVRLLLDDGTKVNGQVWAKGSTPRCAWVWVALDTGHYARVYTDTGRAEVLSAQLAPVQGGKVAA
jgi:hypothetical protein